MEALHCDLVDAIAITPESVRGHAIWPEVGGAIAFSPVALDCPALDWAGRHGVVIESRRVGTFITTDHRIALFGVDERGVHVWIPDWSPEITWSQTWVLDDRLYLFAEVGTGRARTTLVVDAVAGTHVDFNLKDGEIPVVEIDWSRAA
jgi:hypothetical protein